MGVACLAEGKPVTGERGFVQGAMLLAAAAAISKLLGSVYTIVLQNVIGDHGMGLFQMAYPIYATLLAVATAGFPVAISKLVSERLALGDVRGSRKIFHVSATLLTLFGILCFGALFFGASAWAQLAGDPQAVFALRAIAPALLFVPMVSVLRGYFQGYQWMRPTAASQVIEQLVRVLTIIGLSVWLVSAGYGEAMAAAGAAFGAVTGAVAAFLMLSYDWLHRHPEGDREDAQIRTSAYVLSKQLIYYAFPISLGALVVPLMNNVDVVTVVNLLKQSGESQSIATTHFGLLTGRAFKLMMLPTSLASGIGIAVMPAISEAFTLGFRKMISDRVDTAIRLTMLLSLPAGVGLALLAAPVDIALFKDAAGTETIRIMAVATVFASIQSTVAAVLQGCGWMYLPVVNLVIAAVVKLVGNVVLVPVYGIQGAAAATVISYAVAAILNLVAMRKLFKTPLAWSAWIVKPLFSVVVMGGVVYALERQWSAMGGALFPRLATALWAVVAVGIGVTVYGIAGLAAGTIKPYELSRVPVIGQRLVHWCTKIGLVH